MGKAVDKAHPTPDPSTPIHALNTFATSIKRTTKKNQALEKVQAVEKVFT